MNFNSDEVITNVGGAINAKYHQIALRSDLAHPLKALELPGQSVTM